MLDVFSWYCLGKKFSLASAVTSISVLLKHKTIYQLWYKLIIMYACNYPDDKDGYELH